MSQTTVVEKPPLTKLLAGDAGAALIAGVAVTPVIAAVDRALAENASGKMKLWPSFFNSFKEMAMGPIKFLRSPQFFWVWATYGGTYMGVNMCKSICEVTDTNTTYPVLGTSFCVNTTLCIMKDRAFAQLYGTKAPQKVPLGSYGAWLGRDIISMAFIFTLPPIVGKQIAEYTGSEKNGYYAAQFGLPLFMQTFTTPIHLLGYDIYNNPGNSVSQRIAFMGKDYFANVGVRIIRMAPPWSIGTIGNTTLRNKFHGRDGFK